MIVDISNTQLRLPSTREFRANNPVESVDSVTVSNRNANSIQVRVTGTAGVPQVKVFESDQEGLILSLTPAQKTANQPPAPVPETPEPEAEGNEQPVQEQQTPEAEPEGDEQPASVAQEEEIEVLVTRDSTGNSSFRETANLERIEILKGPASVLYGTLHFSLAELLTWSQNNRSRNLFIHLN